MHIFQTCPACRTLCLQLTVQEGLSSQPCLGDRAGMGRRIVGQFKNSPLPFSRLRAIQKQLGQDPKRREQDIPTRWSSSLDMLQSLLKQKHARFTSGGDSGQPARSTPARAPAADTIPVSRAQTPLLQKTAETEHP